jgi:hypothetical protein
MILENRVVKSGAVLGGEREVIKRPELLCY